MRMLTVLSGILSVSFALASSAAFAAGAVHVEEQEWDFKGALKHEWDKDTLYRGYAVATQVCMACHSMKYISHRNLQEAGFTEAEAKALAAEMDMDVNAPLLSGLGPEDAKEVYGKPVPDLSLMNKARGGGADYVYAILTGYADENTAEGQEELHHAFPDGVPEGAYYNRAFPGYAIAMPNPIVAPDMVVYHDETEASIEQMAKDVTYFMQWTAEPERMDRNSTGVYVLLYVLVLIVLTFLTKKAIWKDIH